MRKNPLLIVLTVIGIFFFIVLIFIFSLTLSFREKKIKVVSGRDNIVVINIKGLLTDRSIGKVLKQIRDYQKTENVTAFVFRIDSPGGVVGATQEICKEIQRLKEKRKVVVSLGSVAASGGYYIACAAHKIIANPGTLTGSIGVLMEFANLEQLFKWAKMEPYIIKSGKFKDLGSPLRAMREDEKKIIEKLIQDVHEQFKEVILANRPVSRELLDEIADGRILTGRQALQYKLVDEIGTLEDAIDEAASLANIKGKPHVIYPKEEGIIKLFWDDGVSNLLQKLSPEYGARLLYLMRP